MTAARLDASDPRERLAAASLLAGAFAKGASPSYAWVLAGSASGASAAQRERLLAELFERNLALQEGDPAWCSRAADGRLQAAFLLTPSDAQTISLCTMLRGGLLRVMWRMGMRSTMRLLQLKGWHEKVHGKIMQGRRHLVLERMAVQVDCRGRGIGSAALASALAAVAAAEALPVLLATQEERNVRFYSRLGFEVAHEEVFPEGVRNWFMVRQP